MHSLILKSKSAFFREALDTLNHEGPAVDSSLFRSRWYTDVDVDGHWRLSQEKKVITSNSCFSIDNTC